MKLWLVTYEDYGGMFSSPDIPDRLFKNKEEATDYITTQNIKEGYCAYKLYYRQIEVVKGKTNV